MQAGALPTNAILTRVIRVVAIMPETGPETGPGPVMGRITVPKANGSRMAVDAAM